MESEVTIAIVGEDHAHRILATRLLDAVLVERGQGVWPQREELPQARTWVGWEDAPDADERERFFRTSRSVRDELGQLMGRGYFRVPRIGDEPAGDAAWFIAIYQMFTLRTPRVHGLVVLRDSDGDEALVRGADRATIYIRTLQRPGPPDCAGCGAWISMNEAISVRCPGRYRTQEDVMSAGTWSIGPWEVREEIGHGGNAVVYRCSHATDLRKAAVKLLIDTGTESQATRAFWAARCKQTGD